VPDSVGGATNLLPRFGQKDDCLCLIRNKGGGNEKHGVGLKPDAQRRGGGGGVAAYSRSVRGVLHEKCGRFR